MAANFAAAVFGWRVAKNKKLVPNVADSDSAASIAIASELNQILGIPAVASKGAMVTGTVFEGFVRAGLAADLEALTPGRFSVEAGRPIRMFNQYRHLARIDALIKADTSGTLSAEIGRDYEIKPDVVVSEDVEAEQPLLHAFVSCKLTIRSDRVQNVRHEGIILTRHRRGRQPHVVAVTAEPFPSRLASIARGTGELDGVYHVALEELVEAVAVCGSAEQQRTLAELITQERLFDFSALAPTLAI